MWRELKLMTINTPDSGQNPQWIKGISFDPETQEINNDLLLPAQVFMEGLTQKANTIKEDTVNLLNRRGSWNKTIKQDIANFSGAASALGTLYNNFVDNALQMGCKFIFLSPVDGNLTTIRERVLSAVSGSLINYPNFSSASTVMAVVCVSSTTTFVESMVNWGAFATTLFGETDPSSNPISKALEFPLLSPLRKTIQKEQDFVNSVEGSVGSIPGMLISTPSSLLEGVKNSYSSSTLGKFMGGNTSLGRVLGIAPSEEFLTRKEVAANRVFSTIESGDPLIPSLGEKIFRDENGQTIVDKLLSDPYDKWYDVEKIVNLFGGVGQVMEMSKDVLKDLGGLSDDAGKAISFLVDKIETDAIATTSALASSSLSANQWIQKASIDFESVFMNALWIPPTQGGLEALRIRLTEYINPEAPGAPPYPTDGKANIVFMLVAGVPSLTEGALNPVADQIKTLFKPKEN